MSEVLLKAKIQEAMKEALRGQEKERLGVIRLILAQLKQVEVDERIQLEDGRILEILDKMLKQRRDSIQQFQAAARHDLVQKEEYEVSVIRTFLPEALTEQQIEQLIQEALQATNAGAEGMKGMSLMMAYLKPKLQGRADLGKVGAKVKQQLEQSDPR